MKITQIQDEIEKLKINKQKDMENLILEITQNKSKYSSFGGDNTTCSIKIPNYLKNHKI